MGPSEAQHRQSPESGPAPAVDAGRELSFVRELLSRNVFRPDEQKRLDDYVRQVENRAMDQSLYLAVLGEFNSGKSTFINALLRLRLLKSAPKATTASATKIRYGTNFSLKVRFTDGTSATGSESDYSVLANRIRSLTSQEQQCSKLQDVLHIVTADPAITPLIGEVDITLPAERLRDGTCIIDTPGIGAGDTATAHHNSVTERVTGEIADAAVVLIPSDSAMSRTLLEFLGGSTRRFLHRCIFVITKMDHLEEPDRESVCDFVKSKLGAVMTRRPVILQSAAATMLRSSDRADSEHWRQGFLNLEGTLHQELSRNRSAIIAEHLAALLQVLLTGLQDAVSAKKVALDKERAALEQNSVAALEGVLSRLFEQCRAELQQQVQNCRLRVADSAESFEEKAVKTAGELLDAATRSTLTTVVETDVPAAVAAHQRDFDSACEAQFARLRSSCEEVQKLFARQFEKSYSNLRALGMRIEVSKFAAVSDSIGKGHFSLAGDFLNASRKAREEMGKKVGGCLGTLAAPFAGGIGAFIGGIAGCSVNHPSFESWFTGVLFGGMLGFVASIVGGRSVGGNIGVRTGNFSEQLTEVLNILIPEVRQHCSNVKAGWIQQFDQALASALTSLGHSVAAHTREYEGAVKQMLDEHSRRRTALASQSKQAESDSAELLRRRRRLDEARDALLRV